MHQMSSSNGSDVLPNWGLSNHKSAPCDPLGKDKRLQGTFFPEWCSSWSCARWLSLFWAKEHRGAAGPQSTELCGSWEADAPFRTPWHFHRDLIMLPHCSFRLPFFFFFQFLPSLSLPESLPRKSLNICSTFIHSIHPEIILEVRN